MAQQTVNPAARHTTQANTCRISTIFDPSLRLASGLRPRFIGLWFDTVSAADFESARASGQVALLWRLSPSLQGRLSSGYWSRWRGVRMLSQEIWAQAS